MKNIFNAISDFFKNDPNRIDEFGWSRLQRAVANNDLKKVEGLIKAGADANLSGGKAPFPPLHLAVMKDFQRIVMALLGQKIDVNLRDGYGNTALHYAVERGQESVVLALLKMGADPNIRNDDGEVPLHCVPPGTPRLVDILSSHKADVNAGDLDGNTPLHIFLDHPVIVERLMENGADPNQLNVRRVSPYMMMLDERRIWRNPGMLEKMISCKANLGAVNPMGETVLHVAARLEMEDVFYNIVGRAELMTVDAHHNNVLHVLARTQNVLMIARVLERAPELVLETNSAGMTPLDELLKCAANPYNYFGKKFTLSATMLLNHKANPSSVDLNGRSLLHHAVIHDQVEFLEVALEKGADPDIADRDGKTALHLAIENRNMRAMDTLLDAGADPDMTDNRGWTILDRMAEKGDRESPMVQRLIVAGGQYQKQLPLNPEMMRRPQNRIKKSLNKAAAPKKEEPAPKNIVAEKTTPPQPPL